MKTILEINGINYGSTGTITLNIAECARKYGYKVYTSCKKSRKGIKFNYKDQIFIGFWISRVISERLAFITSKKGYFNILNTYIFLKKIDRIKPDLIHLHLLHDSFINIKMLVNYINKNNIPVIYTFHDCWALTGQCAHFDYVKCNKWKTECHDCVQLHKYPSVLFYDNTKKMYKSKLELFSSIKNMTIVAPSEWMADIVSKSYLNKYEIKIINNGIDLNEFKYSKNSIKKKYNITNKYLVLGVAYGWYVRKGLDVFIELSKKLPNNFQIMLVGTTDEVDKGLPKNIISIHRTYDKKELTNIYSAADIFVNATREDNFPTVNIEALACGLPVLTFDTGGSKEIIDKTCGDFVKQNDITSLINKIIKICENKKYKKDACISRAKQYNMYDKFEEYVKLYDEKLRQI